LFFSPFGDEVWRTLKRAPGNILVTIGSGVE
jgi:hypothetical protein